eukprot:TRINITY_DN14355_c0_g1_i3.p1 TRINITY_DN14355_c0_g1~~TRINITY_DN14355_c0_g1_i3.p1  ORF type:complete len:233 (-),score=44.91 TRINITY_DN14355_c0_g1_i3:48-746(-)
MTRCQAGKVQRMGKLRNTRLCAFFLAQKCKYADQCSFAHDTDDILEKPNLAKTKICYKWQRGRCALSAAECRFAHGELDKNGGALMDSERPLFGKNVSLSSSTTTSTSASEGNSDHEEELLASKAEEYFDHSMSTFGHQVQSPNGTSAETSQIKTAHAISPLAPMPLAQSALFKKQAVLETCLTIFFARSATMAPDQVAQLAASLAMTPPCAMLGEKLEKLLQEAMPEKYED